MESKNEWNERVNEWVFDTKTGKSPFFKKLKMYPIK